MLKFDAINQMLESIGELRLADGTVVETLEVGSDGDIARNILVNTTRSKLKEGWSFNTEEWTFYPDTNQFIHIPKNFLSVICADPRYSVKDRGIYDEKTKTFFIDRPILTTVIVDSDFDNCPFIFQDYVTKAAISEIIFKTLGATDLYRIAKAEEAEAKRSVEYTTGRDNRVSLVSGWGLTDKRGRIWR